MITRRLCRWMLWTLLTLSPGLAHAGLYVFIDGVPGGSKDANRSQWLDAMAASASVDPATQKAASNSPSVELTIEEGPWSARLALYVATGTRVRRVVIEETANVGTVAVVVSRITLDNVSIRSMKTVMSFNPQSLAQLYGRHQVEIGYGRVTWENWAYDPSGRVVAALKTGFDYEKGLAF